MKNKITSLMILIILLLFTPQLHNKVNAEEYEKNILISCESKEIDINDIPENREVELNVSIENNPGFIVLGMYVKYDLRLQLIDEYYICEGLESQSGIIYEPFAYFNDDNEGFVKMQIFTKNEELSKNDEKIMKLIFKIPTDAKIGDEYKIELVNNAEYTTFYFLPNNDEMYREEYFSEPNNGIIRLVGNSSEINDSPANNIEENNNTETDNKETLETESTKISEFITSEITKVTLDSTAVVSSSLTQQNSAIPASETVVTTTSATSSEPKVITSEESTSQNSTSVAEKTEHDEVNKRSYIIPIALSAMIIAAVSVISAKRKKHK